VAWIEMKINGSEEEAAHKFDKTNEHHKLEG
jgi:hypothetical protein